MTHVTRCDLAHRLTRARGAKCTVEWADLWVGLTHRVNDSQVVHSSGWAFHEMGHKKHRVRATWAPGVGQP